MTVEYEVPSGEHSAFLDASCDFRLDAGNKDIVRLTARPDCGAVVMQAQNFARATTVSLSPEQAVALAHELLQAARRAMAQDAAIRAQVTS